MKIVLIILIIMIIFANRELKKQLQSVREINRTLRRNERTFKAMLDRVNLKSKTAYREDIWKSHKALKEIEKISDYKNKALDSDYQSKI